MKRILGLCALMLVMCGATRAEDIDFIMPLPDAGDTIVFLRIEDGVRIDSATWTGAAAVSGLDTTVALTPNVSTKFFARVVFAGDLTVSSGYTEIYDRTGHVLSGVGVEAIWDQISIRAIVEDSGGNSATRVQTSLSEATTFHYDNMLVYFLSGTQEGQSRKIRRYNAVFGYIEWVDPVAGGLTAGDSLVILPWGFVSVDSFNTDAINADAIAADAIGASEIAANAIGVTEIATGAISANAIASNTITAVKIAANAITAAKIAADAIGASEIATDAIGSDEIAAGAIGASEIATNAIDADAIAANAIGASEIGPGAIGASEIAADAIGASELASDAVKEIWDIAFATGFTAGSMGDSLNNPTYVQGAAGSVDSTLLSNLMHRIGWGTPKGSGSDSSTQAERDVTGGGGGGGLDTLSTDFQSTFAALMARENWTISSADDSTYAASTMGLNSKEWDFGSGGSGSGSDSIITYDTTNGVIVPYITVTMRNLAGTSNPLAIVTTDQNGAAVILLNDSGQVTATQAGFTAILDTINNKPGPDTIFLTSFNPGIPTDNSFSRVYGFIKFSEDSAVIGAQVTATLRGGANMRDTVAGVWVAPRTFSTGTNSDGYFFMDIRKTAFLNQPASYNIEARVNGLRIFMIAGFLIPDQDSIEVIP